MARKANIASTAGGAVVSRYLGMALTFLTFSILSHMFGKEGLGHYASAFGLASTLCYFLGFGAPEGVARLAAAGGRKDAAHRQRLVRSAHGLALLSGAGVIAVVVAAALLALPASLRWNTIWTGVWVVGWGINISASLCLIASGSERAGSFFFYTAGASLNFVLVLLAMALGWGPPAVLAISASSYLALGLIGSVQIWLVLRREPIAPRGESQALALVKAGAPFSGARIIQSAALWIPVWGAGLLSGVAAAGVIGAVMRLAVAAAAAMAAIRLVLRRVIADQLTSGHYRRLAIMASVSGTIFAGLTLVGVVLVWFFGDWGLSLLFGKSFAGNRALLCLALIATAAESQFGIAEDILKNKGAGLKVMAVQAAAIVLAFGPMFVLRFQDMTAYVGAYVGYVAITQAAYVVWLGRARGIWIRPMLSRRVLKTFMRIRH
ncbi:lipopolysaccharide biosynthesis protein [Caulobacter sp.]|uniref:lipopolysaccharide biosynthesis protein n=1 Tax=Caulobacter sp. TaxID=78 RepID=UPI003BAC9CD4